MEQKFLQTSRKGGLFYALNKDMENTQPQEPEWSVDLTFGINEARALYSTIQYAIQMWPGAPARPAEEQEFLFMMRDRMFMIIMEYNLEFMSAD